MRRPALPQRVSRGAAFAVVLAFVVQAMLGMPVLLRMTPGLEGVAFCSVGHAAGAPPGPAHIPAGHDHAHCLLCQAGPVPPPVTAAAVPFAPRATAGAALFPGRACTGLPQRPRPAFASRAPPLTA